MKTFSNYSEFTETLNEGITNAVTMNIDNKTIRIEGSLNEVKPGHRSTDVEIKNAAEFCKKSKYAQALAKELAAKFDIDNDDMNDAITTGAAKALYKLIEKG